MNNNGRANVSGVATQLLSKHDLAGYISQVASSSDIDKIYAIYMYHPTISNWESSRYIDYCNQSGVKSVICHYDDAVGKMCTVNKIKAAKSILANIAMDIATLEIRIEDAKKRFFDEAAVAKMTVVLDDLNAKFDITVKEIDDLQNGRQ